MIFPFTSSSSSSGSNSVQIMQGVPAISQAACATVAQNHEILSQEIQPIEIEGQPFKISEGKAAMNCS